MKVSTSEFEIDPRAYARMLAIAYVKSHAFTYVMFSVAVVMYRSDLLFMVIGTGVALVFYRLWGFYRFTRDPDNDSFFDLRRYTFTEEMLEATSSDGSEVRQPIGTLVRAEHHADHWQLFVSSAQIHYIPFAAVPSEAELERLETILRAKVRVVMKSESIL